MCRRYAEGTKGLRRKEAVFGSGLWICKVGKHLLTTCTKEKKLRCKYTNVSHKVPFHVFRILAQACTGRRVEKEGLTMTSKTGRVWDSSAISGKHVVGNVGTEKRGPVTFTYAGHLVVGAGRPW